MHYVDTKASVPVCKDDIGILYERVDGNGGCERITMIASKEYDICVQREASRITVYTENTNIYIIS